MDINELVMVGRVIEAEHPMEQLLRFRQPSSSSHAGLWSITPSDESCVVGFDAVRSANFDGNSVSVFGKSYDSVVLFDIGSGVSRCIREHSVEFHAVNDIRNNCRLMKLV